MIIFYATINGDTAELTPDESLHCARVLRSQPGEAVRLIDGRGNFYDASLVQVHDKRTTAKITGGPFPETPRSYRFHLAVAPTKHTDRMEWLVEKCTEIGVDRITFFTSRHSERKEIRTDRMQKIALSAAKQSLRAGIPLIGQSSLHSLITSTTAGIRLIAHCGDGERSDITTIRPAGKETLVLIGPEGDFSGTEVGEALAAGFKAIDLGPSRLRTETAALCACHAISVLSRIK